MRLIPTKFLEFTISRIEKAKSISPFSLLLSSKITNDSNIFSNCLSKIKILFRTRILMQISIIHMEEKEFFLFLFIEVCEEEFDR
jgi:hypothetical protein